MTRLPLLTGSRLHVVEPADDAIVLRAPPPLEALADVGAAAGMLSASLSRGLRWRSSFRAAAA